MFVSVSTHGGLDPAEEALVAGPVVTLGGSLVRWSAAHRNVCLLLLLSDDGGVRFLAACRRRRC